MEIVKSEMKLLMNEKYRIKIGVAGAGSMGANHIRIVSELNSIFDFVGIFDPNTDKISVAEKYGVLFFNSYEEMLENVDAVIIASPTSLHYSMAMKAAEKDVCALVEKPMTENLDEAQNLIDAFNNKGLTLGVSYVERFNPVIDVLKSVIKNEEIVSIEVHRCSPYDNRIFDVDVITDLMCHDVDLITNAILDETPISVDAIGRKFFTDRFADYSQSILKFNSGVIAFDTASRCTQDKIRTFIIHAKAAYIEADMLNRTLTIKRRIKYEKASDDVNYVQSAIIEQINVPNKEPLKEDLINFGNSLMGKDKLRITGEHILRSMKTLDEIHNVVYEKGI